MQINIWRYFGSKNRFLLKINKFYSLIILVKLIFLNTECVNNEYYVLL